MQPRRRARPTSGRRRRPRGGGPAAGHRRRGKLGTTIARRRRGRLRRRRVRLRIGPRDRADGRRARPRAHAVTTDEVVRHADIIVLAVPTHRFRELPRDLFAGKIVIGAMNYWEPADGDDAQLAAAPDGTSVIVQARFPSARAVNGLNQLGYHEVEEHRRPNAAADRVAIGAAGDDRLAVRAVMRLIDRLGFDPVDVGALENGLALEPDGSPYALVYTADQLRERIARQSEDLCGPISGGCAMRDSRIAHIAVAVRGPAYWFASSSASTWRASPSRSAARLSQ